MKIHELLIGRGTGKLTVYITETGQRLSFPGGGFPIEKGRPYVIEMDDGSRKTRLIPIVMPPVTL